jgi:hypothetical protein
MTTWSDRPPPASRRLERLAAVRDVAIIAVCALIVGLALLALLGSPREAPERATRPAVVRVAR